MKHSDAASELALEKLKRLDFNVDSNNVPVELINKIANQQDVPVSEINALYRKLAVEDNVNYRALLEAYTLNNPYDLNLLDSHALLSYTTNYYHGDLNFNLIKSLATDNDLALAAAIDTALSKLPKQSSSQSFTRVVDLPEAAVQRYNDNFIITEPQFTSVSKGTVPSSNYSGEWQFIIQSRSARDISSFSMDRNFSSQIGQTPVDSEYLIPRNITFRSEVDHENFIIYLTEIE